MEPIPNSNFSTHAVVSVIGSSCRRCKDCIDICPEEALSWAQGRVVIAEEKCTGCGRCVQLCRIKVLKIVPRTPPV